MTVALRDNSESFADDIERTVNYSALCAAVRDFIRAQSPRLIETLAANLAAHLLENFPVRKIDIELRKFVVPDTQYVSVALSREAKQ